MTEFIISILASIIAAIILMILHEFPKTLIYYLKNKKTHKGLKHIFKLYHYIDPVGLLFFVVFNVGFSKPYMCSNRDRKTNIIMGITGFLILVIVCLGSGLLLIALFFNGYSVGIDFVDKLIGYILLDLVLFSGNMFIVNLFPISTFDIAQIIAGIKPKIYYSLVQHDTVVKGILIISTIFGLIGLAGQIMFSILRINI